VLPAAASATELLLPGGDSRAPGTLAELLFPAAMAAVNGEVLELESAQVSLESDQPIGAAAVPAMNASGMKDATGTLLVSIPKSFVFQAQLIHDFKIRLSRDAG